MPSARVTTFESEPAVTLAGGEVEATFLPSLSMLGVSLRHRGDELLAPVGSLDRYRAGHVTGIPFLHPWANRLGAWRYRIDGTTVEVARDAHVDQHGLPIHGTVAGIPFDIVQILAGRLRARLDATTQPRIMTSFPFPHVVEIDVRVDDDGTLAVTTTVHATGGTTVPISFGYHPYFSLPGAPRDTWHVRLPSRRHVDLDDRQLPTGTSTREPPFDDVFGARTLDDHYRLGRDRRFEIATAGRTIVVTFDRGFPYAQLFAPPGADFLCVEPMTAPVDALVSGDAPLVEPGRRFRATWRVHVR